MSTTTPRRLRPHARGFLDCLREFLTPVVWKQAHQQRYGHKRRDRKPRGFRWDTQPLILMLLLMTWCCGDSQPERFETARAFCVVLLPKKRRPGTTVQGFQKALAKVPTRALRAVADGIRKVLHKRLADRWSVHGFIPFGCDGSRVECPRTAELEQRMGKANKEKTAPSVWVTALVHLCLGVPWAWRIGPGTASERAHLLTMLDILPANALLVADAGFHGFPLAQRLVEQQVHFLLRMCSNVTLYMSETVPLSRYREGLVYYFPPGWKRSKRNPGKPLLLRLIRVRARKKRNDVWLLTNVRDSQRLSAATAAWFFRKRWENEGQFRAYKRTLNKVKLVSRTVRLVHREAEGSLLAMQLMLAQAALAMRVRSASGKGEAPVCSPRKVLLAIRQELYGLVRRGSKKYFERLQQAQRERRKRTSAKAVRPWPRRKPHKAPKPPKLLELTEEQKAIISRLECTAA